MVIGIHLAYGNKYVGGGHVYQKCLFDDIVAKQGSSYARHRIIFFYSGENDLIKNQPGNYVNTQWYKGGLNEAAMRHRVDVVWFLSIATVDLDIPHILPVWDLQHCLQPFFPEVSSGGEYVGRDKAYGHFLPRASYVLTGTEAGRKEISFFYRIPPERIVVNPLPLPQHMSAEPVAMTAELAPLGLQKNGFLFYPAQFWPHKNHILLLEAVKILKEKHGMLFKLVLTGSDHGNMPYVRRKIAAMGLERDVHLLGFVENETILWLYQNALALTYPSFFGPDNIPPIEAFSVGCPVIAARVSGSEDQLGDAALLVDPKDEHAFVAAIMRLAAEPALRGELIEKGRRVAQGRTAAIYVERVFELIDGFAPIRRCWYSHFTLKYTPDMLEWMSAYAKEKEVHSLVTLLSLCGDQPLVEQYNEVLNRFKNVVAAHEAAEAAVSRSELDSAAAILKELLAECVDYAPAYKTLAKVHYSRSELDAALALLQRGNYYESRLKGFDGEHGVMQ